MAATLTPLGPAPHVLPAPAGPRATAPALSLVIPAYNEAQRLPSTLDQVQRFAREHALDCEVIVVDNGSRDATSDVVLERQARFPELKLLRTERAGKGLAVRSGVLAARGRVVLFADADCSWDLAGLLTFPALVGDRTHVVIGTRHGVGETYEPGLRHVMSRVFNLIVQALAVPGIRDTQCGFKAFRADAARNIFSRTTIDGFGFDVEVLFLARRLGYGIAEAPLRWEHQENSRVSPLRDSLRMLREVLSIRLNALKGRYARVPSPAAPAIAPVLRPALEPALATAA